ncbi:MAG: hypothetical protein PHG63_03855 [Candidatus Dojkabacteria bacterium]|nr:hypothetical protein [Candidatus Dojkabacteria bacterium]
MVCIWLGREGKGGYVAQSKTSYGDLMRRWNETGTPPYANPDEFTSLGIQAGYAEVSERYGHQFREGPLPPDVRIWIVPVDQNGHTTGEKEEMTIRELRKRYFGSLEE